MRRAAGWVACGTARARRRWPLGRAASFATERLASLRGALGAAAPKKQPRRRGRAGRERSVPLGAWGGGRPGALECPHVHEAARGPKRHHATTNGSCQARRIVNALSCIDAAAPRLRYGGLTRASPTPSSASFPAASAAPCESRQGITQTRAVSMRARLPHKAHRIAVRRLIYGEAPLAHFGALCP